MPIIIRNDLICDEEVPNLEESERVALASGAVIPLVWNVAARPLAILVLAPHSNAGLDKPFMRELAQLLEDNQVSTVRFDFPFMLTLSRRPSPLCTLADAIHGVTAAARRRYPSLPLLLGGSSFGARTVAEVQAKYPVDNVQGLVFLGFPLHPVNRPSAVNSRSLLKLEHPKLFLQGVGDAAADAVELERCLKTVAKARLRWIETNDNSLRSISRRESRSGRTGARESATEISNWLQDQLSNQRSEEPLDPRLNVLNEKVARAEQLVAQQRAKAHRPSPLPGEGALADQVLDNWVEALDLMRWKRDLLDWLLSNPNSDPRVAEPNLVAATPAVIAQALEGEVGSGASPTKLPAEAFREVLVRVVFNRYG